MMDQESGRFLIINDPHGGPVASAVLSATATTKYPRPVLAVGEDVQVKGVWFRVLRIKADGKLGLRMLKGEEVPK